jgi:peptidoglycan/LPS O-acetylase OafA/YrhL
MSPFMNKYKTPLKFNGFIKLTLLVLSCFVISPVFLLVDFGFLNINGLEYNLKGYFWLKAIGVSCLSLIGVMAILIQEQVKYSLSGLGIVLLLTTLSNLLHPSIIYTDFLIALAITALISSLLFKKDYHKLKSGRMPNKSLEK